MAEDGPEATSFFAGQALIISSLLDSRSSSMLPAVHCELWVRRSTKPSTLSEKTLQPEAVNIILEKLPNAHFTYLNFHWPRPIFRVSQSSHQHQMALFIYHFTQQEIDVIEHSPWQSMEAECSHCHVYGFSLPIQDTCPKYCFERHAGAVNV